MIRLSLAMRRLPAFAASLSSPYIAVVTLLLCIAVVSELRSQDYSSVQQIFQKHCIDCHGPQKREGGLRLDRAQSIVKGGDSGPTIVRRHADMSELIRRVASTGEDRMPPEGTALSAEEISHISRWIELDLPGLPDNEGAEEDPRLKHWAWQPIEKPKIPNISLGESHSAYISHNAIDLFVIAKLQERGLSQSPIATLRERLRRLSFDLRGLPLTPEQLDELTSQIDSADIYEKAVNRFLVDPAYGEKWARHWLDIAHYADTHGFERDQRRPNAWRYRDYVIDSWNSDLPYNQFVRQQIAGDLIAPRDQRSVIATGFLAAGPYDFVGQEETQSEVLRRQARADDLDDILTQVMTSLCGVTIHCARCHDHKLDPIAQTEYYEMIALFASVRRTDRPVDYLELKGYEEEQHKLTQRMSSLRSDLKKLRNQGLDLADIIGGGNGFGTGTAGAGLDPASGNVQIEKRGFLDGIRLNHFNPIQRLGIDGIAIPDGLVEGINQRLQITSTGLEIPIPDTSGAAWDAVRYGPVNSQHSTQLAGIEYGTEHAMLGTHANVAITFDLDQLRQNTQKEFSHFRSGVGYFGQTEKEGASVAILLDGTEAFKVEKLGRNDGLKSIDIALNSKTRFLTLLITDAGNGISHDQVCFIDPTLSSDDLRLAQTDTAKLDQEIRRIELELQAAQLAKDQLASPSRYYGVNVAKETPIFRLRRGNPEDPIEEVKPNAIRCLPVAMNLSSSITTDEERRLAFADWLADADHPLLARVIVNRLWHYHFGRGLVDTPSDFGLGGSLPSHPELLDWLASELIEHDWSLKHIQRLICCSYTYQQSSLRNEAAFAQDSQNQFLWRRSPKRLDAEALRDSVLLMSGCLDRRFHGPGYEDFDYQEEYAPVYRYKPANEPNLWRRSIYRYIVRTTTHQFLATLDCPNAANLTPVRDRTTTPLQALALLNNDFMRDQAARFADRLQQECGDDSAAKVERAFILAFSRAPSQQEKNAAIEMILKTDAATFCLILFNTNEFIFVD
jgi:mono/diheme cytochrome c family protein